MSDEEDILDLQEDLAQLREDALAIIQPNQTAKDNYASKPTAEARQRAVNAKAKDYADLQEEIRDTQIDLRTLTGRGEELSELTEAEKENFRKEAFSKIMIAIGESVEESKQTTTQSFLMNQVYSGNKNVKEELEKFIKTAVPFNPDTGSNISLDELYSRKFDAIDVKNPANFPVALENRLDKIVNNKAVDKETKEELSVLINNIKMAISANEDLKDMETDTANIEFPMHEYFGAINLSKEIERDAVYDYWQEINELYAPFEDAIEGLISAIRASGDEAFIKRANNFSREFEKLKSQSETNDFSYVVEIPPVTIQQISPFQTMLNIVRTVIQYEGLADSRDNSIDQNYKDDSADAMNNIDREIMEGAGQSFSDNDFTGASTDFEAQLEVDDYLSSESKEELDALANFRDRAEADVLLALQVGKGNKVTSVNNAMRTKLRELISQMKDLITLRSRAEIGMDAYFDKWIAEADESLTLERGDYFVPISVLMADDAGILQNLSSFDKEDADKQLGIISDLFEALEILIRDPASQTMLPQVPQKGKDGSSIDSFDPDPAEIGRLSSASRPRTPAKRVSKLPEYMQTEKIEKALTELFNVTYAYFIEPILGSGKLPVSYPSFSNRLGFKDFLNIGDQLGVEFDVGMQYVKASKGEIDNITQDDLRHLRDFFSSIRKQDVKINNSLLTKARLAISSLTQIFGGKAKNYEYIGSMLIPYIEDANKMEMLDRTLKGDSRSIRELGEQYSETKTYAAKALPLFLELNKGLFEGHPNRKVQTEYNSLVKVIEQTEGFEYVPKQVLAMLKAHDTIRKALGKEVRFGYLPLNDSGVNTFIESQGLDLTTFEVTNIAKSYDSHKELSREFGISTEDVYFLKASFR